MRLAPVGLKFRFLVVRQLQCRPVIHRRLATTHLDLAFHVQLFGGLVTGVKPPFGLQLFHHAVVTREAFALAEGLVPLKAQPLEVRLDGFLILKRGALAVGIVDTKHKGAALLPRKKPVHKSSADVTHMQFAGG